MFIDDDEGTDDAHLTHQSLIDTQERLGALLELMPTGLLIHQMQGILYANKQVAQLFEASPNALVGQHILDYVDEKVHDEWTKLFMQVFVTDQAIRLPEFRFTNTQGRELHIRATAGRLPWDGTSVVQVLLEDITELREQTEELRKLTLFDPLTGAYNRRYFMEATESLIHKALQDSNPFSLLIFDIDHFKNVNDTFGHLAGDEALKSIPQIWQQNTRHTKDSERHDDGRLSRIGGEEFAIFLPMTGLEGACALANRFRHCISKNALCYDQQNFFITASFGVTTLRQDDTSLDDLFRRADEALYQAKENGRNRVEFL